MKKGGLKEDMMDELLDGGCRSGEKRDRCGTMGGNIQSEKNEDGARKKIAFWPSGTNNN